MVENAHLPKLLTGTVTKMAGLTLEVLTPSALPRMANTFGHPDACSRLLRILGPEQRDVPLALDHRWLAFFRRRLRQATW
jgi:hypothetical protein